MVSLVEPIGERSAFDVLHHEEDRVAGASDAVDRHDVRVLERRRDACFALKALDECGVERERSWKNLDGDVSIERALAGAEDDGHAAAAELFVDVVFVGEGGPNKCRFIGRFRGHVVRAGGRRLIQPARRTGRGTHGKRRAAAGAGDIGVPGFRCFRHGGNGGELALREGAPASQE
jgi:hypothetical protein